VDVNEWLLCLSKAYDVAEKEFSTHKKRLLKKKLKLPLEDLSKEEAVKSMFRMGVESVLPLWAEFQGEVEETIQVLTHYFFRKAIHGETFGPIARIKERFSPSLEENYELTSGPFINIARTYWTYNIEVHDLFPQHYDLTLAQILLKVERDLGSLFFPTPGKVVIWVRQRSQLQRQLLKQYAPQIDIDAFLKNNPILGTSRGRISRTVFEEKILIRCQNSNCVQILRVPNTVKTLRVRCPKCKTSFRFPARDLEWLDQVRPEVHPEPHKIDELESLRRSYGIPQDLFALRVLGSPWAFRRLQESIYTQLRTERPGASEKELLKALFKTRVFALPVGPITSEEEIDKVMESISSLEDLINYFIREEGKEQSSPDPFGIGARIDEILSA